MESAARHSRPNAPPEVFRKGRKHRTAVNNQLTGFLTNSKWIGGSSVRFVDGSFKFYGGLGFIVHLIAHTNDGRDGIEQAASAGCERRIDLALAQLQQVRRP